MCMTKLSFIVPVYNVAPYLRKCVDSLLAQDYDNYEIILVDDGSTDDSWQIIQENVSRFRGVEDARISGIHQENGGLSAARNTGIAAAKGEYICFVDSDDYWEPNVLGKLMAQVERENLDILRFDYQNVRIEAYPQQCSTDGHRLSDRAKLFTRKGKGEDTSKMISGEYEVFEPNKTPRYIDRKNEIVDGETYLNTRMGYACYAVMFILRRDLILPTRVCKKDTFPLGRGGVGLLFTEDLHFKDVDWLPRMMLRAKHVNSTQKVVYNYLHRPGSITMTEGNKEKVRKNLEDEIRVIQNLVHLQETYPNCIWLRNMYSDMASGVLTTVAMDFYNERKEYIRRLRELQVFPLNIADQGRTYVRRARIINVLGAYLYCLIMHRR